MWNISTLWVAGCTFEIKSMVARARMAFNYKKSLFKSKFNFNFMNELVKCYIWDIALYGAAETWILKVDQKNL